MKKVLGLLLAMLMVFSFGLTANAQYDNVSEGECHNCKCPMRTIPCPGTNTVVEGQSEIVVTESAYPFDYDGKPYIDDSDPATQDGFGSFGYSAGYNFANDDTINCKAIFDLCTCDDACDIAPGKKMGIQMVIKTPGVYFADPDVIPAQETDPDKDGNPRAGQNTVFFTMDNKWEAYCSTDSQERPTVTLMDQTAFYFYNNVTGSRVEDDDGTGNVAVGMGVRNFGPVEYYTKYTTEDYEKSGHHYYTITPAHQYSNEEPLSGPHTGQIPARNRVNVLQSFIETDYMFTNADTADALGNCKIWIDIPTMRIDPTVAEKDARIEVELRFLFGRKPAGICPECDPPDMCSCVIADVGQVCDSSGVVVGSEYCMFFPYVLQGIQESDGWATGVAITCTQDEMPEDAWVELELRDRAGNKATYRRENLGAGLVWSFVLDDIMDNFEGTLVPGATALKVNSNYAMDGYQFLNVAGTFGAGSNARGCMGSGSCCPGPIR